MLVGIFGDTTIILAYGPADDVASDRDVLVAVVAALVPDTWSGWRGAPTPPHPIAHASPCMETTRTVASRD